ncbi:DUF805 domain-containing protein [Sphingopyxis sp.]|uniref:DUF805 domain-containing protein n=1 Tax=Sphingopyxis sp. TaxID=1908224 RepID=UPI003D0FE419
MTDISIGRAARRGLAGLFDARGRDDRAQFWFFLLLIFGPLTIVQMVIQTVMAWPSFGASPAGDAGAVPANFAMVEGQFRAMATAAYVAAGLYLLGSLLLLTATARRLHDRGRAGWWAVMLPLATFATGQGQARRMTEIAEQAPRAFAEFEKNPSPDFSGLWDLQVKMQAGTSGPDWTAILGGLVILWLVVELARAGAAGPNRFGPPPE